MNFWVRIITEGDTITMAASATLVLSRQFYDRGKLMRSKKITKAKARPRM